MFADGLAILPAAPQGVFTSPAELNALSLDDQIKVLEGWRDQISDVLRQKLVAQQAALTGKTVLDVELHLDRETKSVLEESEAAWSALAGKTVISVTPDGRGSRILHCADGTAHVAYTPSISLDAPVLLTAAYVDEGQDLGIPPSSVDRSAGEQGSTDWWVPQVPQISNKQ